MKPEYFKAEQIKLNPNNPRLIKDDKFKKLVKSIQDFPEMMELRPIVVDENMVILGGNMRFRAMQEAGVKLFPVIVAKNLTEEQKQEFIIKDNVGFGEWDWEMLANEWDADKLTDWGVEKMKGFSEDDLVDEASVKTQWFLNIEFENETDCQLWYEKLIKEGLICKVVQ